MATETAQSKGMVLNVGALEHPEDVKTETPGGDGVNDTETLDLLSRVVAHIFHRVPGLKNIAKRAEGNEKSAGIFSDLLALIVQIFRRNQDQIYEAVETAGKQWVEAKAAKAAASQTATAAPSSTEEVS